MNKLWSSAARSQTGWVIQLIHWRINYIPLFETKFDQIIAWCLRNFIIYATQLCCSSENECWIHYFLRYLCGELEHDSQITLFFLYKFWPRFFKFFFLLLILENNLFDSQIIIVLHKMKQFTQFFLLHLHFVFIPFSRMSDSWILKGVVWLGL